MINSLNVRAFQNQSPALKIRQQVRAKREIGIPHLLEGKAAIYAITLAIVVCGAAVLGGVANGKLREKVAAVKSEYNQVVEENIALRAVRASKMSEAHVAQVAAAELKLFTPGPKQMQRF